MPGRGHGAARPRILIHWGFTGSRLYLNGAFLLQPLQPAVADIDGCIDITVVRDQAVDASPLPDVQSRLTFRSRQLMAV
jgi:hypothetical protein